MISVDFIPIFIDKDHPVGITIKCDTKVCFVFAYSSRHDFRVERANPGIDVFAVRVDTESYNFGAKLLHDCGGHFIGSAMGTIEYNFKALQVEVPRKSVFQKNNVPANRVIDPKRLADLISNGS